MPILVVQMGHCYRKTGATGTTGEQAFTSAVGEACVRLLNGKNGWTVRKILADESSTNYRGDAFVAIHCDGSTSSSARGASIGYRTPEGQAFGQAWKRAYAARGWPGFRVDNYTTALSQYYGTGTAVAQGNRRAFILEAGFLTNPEDRAILHASGGVERVALAIGDALGIDNTMEDDVSGAEVWSYPLSFHPPGAPNPVTYSAAQWLVWTNYYASANSAAVAAVAKLVSAGEANDLTEAKVTEIVNKATFAATEKTMADMQEAMENATIDVDVTVGGKAVEGTTPS